MRCPSLAGLRGRAEEEAGWRRRLPSDLAVFVVSFDRLTRVVQSVHGHAVSRVFVEAVLDWRIA